MCPDVPEPLVCGLVPTQSGPLRIFGSTGVYGVFMISVPAPAAEAAEDVEGAVAESMVRGHVEHRHPAEVELIVPAKHRHAAFWIESWKRSSSIHSQMGR